jgi:hypothetical protein
MNIGTGIQTVLIYYVGNMPAARSDRPINVARVKVRHTTSYQLQELLEWLGRIIEMRQQVAKGTIRPQF